MSTVDSRVSATLPQAAACDDPGARARADAGIEPELVRVSVLGGNTQLDVGLPARLPVAALIPDLVTQVRTRNSTGPDDVPESEDGRRYDRPNRWTLGLIGQEQIAPDRSLSESGIRDGDLLVLRSIHAGDSPALFDDVVDAVARLNESHFASWSPRSARVAGHAVAVVAAVAAAVALGASRRTDEALWIAGLGGLAAIGLITAGTIVARHHGDRTSAAVLVSTAMPLAFVTGMLLTPGRFGAAHLTLGCAVALVAAVVSYRLTTVGPAIHSAVTTATLLAGFGCGAALLLRAPVSDVAAALAAVGILVVALAPRATIVLARLPLPPIPTAGTSMDAEDIEPRPAIEGIGAIGATVLPRADALERRSVVATEYLTGIIGGTAFVTAVCVILAAAPLSGLEPKSAAYAGIIALVLCLRGRSHSDLAQAACLVGSGSLALIALVTGLAFGSDHWPIIAFAVAMAMAAAAIVLGVIAPNHEFSPVMRRTAEIIEYTLVVVIVPLLLWILDLYRTVREI
ncbi:type VII secretion integral membrane protein EccD [Gordonia sp. SID5947]|uniref:type VII secretion integral membrane protein EccD n=1 Tax=Gordonia sp. SID5947 TaxID=2690315 RepID=UPI00136EA0D0|nr:type VII secretion integral membrane protein EccD [Gordonia sp. SID5947]MYR06269.1 type VII secretion integral membrane protein EccD [Gordonia sp. SID5947]